MDLWIRSQDKQVMAKCNNLIIGNKKQYIFIDDNLFHILNKFELNNYYDLGKYETKERALEVLDDIHHNVLEENIEERLSYEQADIKIKNIIANNMVKIYNMPEE